MSDERRMLDELADRLFADTCDTAVLRAAEAGEWPQAAWHAAEQAGLATACVPEALGGSGFTFADAMAIARAVGRHAVPLPLVETLLANVLLARQGIVPLPGVGTVPVMLEAARPTLERIAGDRWQLNGALAGVPWGAQAQQVVFVARGPDGVDVLLALAPSQATAASPGMSVAREPRVTLRFDAVPVDAETVARGRGPGLADALRAAGAIARCQQMAGAMQWLLERTISYVQERSQFGRPIGGFQSIQHLVATMAGEASAAAAAADNALCAGTALSVADPLSTADRLLPGPELAFAKARVGEAAGVVAAIAHQVHGAIGYSHEYPLHFRARRLWCWREEFGSERHWRIHAGRALAARGGDALWAELTA